MNLFYAITQIYFSRNKTNEANETNERYAIKQMKVHGF